jgi:hypothetical protein
VAGGEGFTLPEKNRCKERWNLLGNSLLSVVQKALHRLRVGGRQLTDIIFANIGRGAIFHTMGSRSVNQRASCCCPIPPSARRRILFGRNLELTCRNNSRVLGEAGSPTIHATAYCRGLPKLLRRD